MSQSYGGFDLLERLGRGCRRSYISLLYFSSVGTYCRRSVAWFGLVWFGLNYGLWINDPLLEMFSGPLPSAYALWLHIRRGDSREYIPPRSHRIRISIVWERVRKGSKNLRVRSHFQRTHNIFSSFSCRMVTGEYSDVLWKIVNRASPRKSGFFWKRVKE